MACKFTFRDSVLFTVILSLTMSFTSPASAQDCTPENIELTSQEEVDDFQANHGLCDHIMHDLSIHGFDITNLDVSLTAGGVFDKTEPVPKIGDPIGFITILWDECENAALYYEIDPPGMQGWIDISHIVPDNVALCEALSIDD